MTIDTDEIRQDVVLRRPITARTAIALCDEVNRLEAEVRDQRETLDQVLALHGWTMRSGDALICRECGDDVPCETVRLIEDNPS